MIWAVLRKELIQYVRDGRVIVLAVVLIGLGAAAALYGRSAVDTMERERAAANQADRNAWDNQGAKNPHTAAHFARYVFRPTSSLAVFDPGLTAYVGRAIWVEAHHRDPAKLRPVDDAVEIQRFAALSPAWILQCLAPLFIVLLAFSSIAGEREQGTLRHVMSSGVRPEALFWGKTSSVLLASLAIVPVVIIGLLFSTRGVTESLPDTPWRIALLVAMYAIYLAGFAFAVVGTSARMKHAKTALVVLLGFWVMSTVVVPRLAADAGEALYPAPAGSTFWAELNKQSSKAFWGKDAKPKRDQIRDDLLKKYGVDTVDALPINYDGYLLQASEEFANDVFDRHYSELAGIFDKQHSVSLWFSILSPTIAARNVSRALVGTDVFAHQHFTDAAEQFRRRFIKALNQDMIDNAGAAGYGYLADESLWKQAPDFDYHPPSIGQVWSRIWLDAGILVGWSVLAFVVARRGVWGSFAGEAQR